jgi:hypothetical protein
VKFGPTPNAPQQPPTTTVATGTTLHARCDESSPVRTPLRAGEVVEIEAIVEGWVHVRLPASGEQGCVRRRALEAIPADVIEQVRRRPDAPRVRSDPSPAPAPAGAPAPGGRAVRIAVFGYGGVLNLAATQSFDAILGESSGPVVGGGGQVAILKGPLRNVFFQVDASQFEETGERVFVSGGEVFKLGIPQTLTLRPLEFTAGYRYEVVRRGADGRPHAAPFVPYAGGGVGIVQFEEHSDFAVTGEDVDERFTSYHVLGGLDVPVWGGLGVGVEAHYRWVPDGLGTGGVSREFNETNLGGATFRVKVGFGF